MTNEEVLRIAMAQSAEDIGCSAEDFLKKEPVLVLFRLGKNARRYYKLPIKCNFVSYGNNVVAAAADEVMDTVSEYIKRYGYYRLFETPNMHWLNARLADQGCKVCFMAEYFLPDVNSLSVRTCGFETRVLGPEDFKDLYLPEWSNALCSDRKELDVLGVGAYEGGRLIGLAACSADCDTMWQIGVDVLPSFRRRGIASALTASLAREIVARGRVPFYCAAWSNIASVRNAVRSGFLPAWVEMTVKPARVVDEMNALENE